MAPLLQTGRPPTDPPSGSVVEVIEFALREFVDGFVTVLPDLIAGIAFLVVAAVVVKVVMALVRFGLTRALPGDSPVYRQFLATLVLLFLVFGVGLSFLSIVGLDGIATSLGTATGFIALGVSYALSKMIADAVSGIYLLRDPDFNPGDTVDIDGTVGEVKAIELRKTRIDVEGDTVVRGNSDIESEWTLKSDEPTFEEDLDDGE